MPKSSSIGASEVSMARLRRPVVTYLETSSRTDWSFGGRLWLVARIRLMRVRRGHFMKVRGNAPGRENAFSARPHPRRLDRAVRLRMLGAMPGWFFDQRSKSFVPSSDAPELVEELLDAVTDLRTETVELRVSGISVAAAARVRGYLQQGSEVVIVNHRTCESVSY